MYSCKELGCGHYGLSACRSGVFESSLLGEKPVQGLSNISFGSPYVSVTFIFKIGADYAVIFKLSTNF